jgi:hypothetical protein
VTLAVHYPPAYPDELPELTLSHDDPNMNEDDDNKLIAELLKVVSILRIELEALYETLLVGNRKSGDGDDFYSGGTFTRTDRGPDTGKD